MVEVEELVAGEVVGDGGVLGGEVIGHDKVLVDNRLLCADDADLVLAHEIVRGGGVDVLRRVHHEGSNVLAGVIENQIVPSRMVLHEFRDLRWNRTISASLPIVGIRPRTRIERTL